MYHELDLELDHYHHDVLHHVMMLRRCRLRLLQPRISAAPARPGEYYRDRPVARAGDAALNSCCSRQAA